MTGIIMTEKGLGDGIESLFQPLLDAINEGVADTDKITFPGLAKKILNAAFSGGVLSSFNESKCSTGNIGLGGLFDVAGVLDEASVAASAGLDVQTLTTLRKAMVSLDPDRRAAAWKAIGIEDLPELPPAGKPGDEVAVLLEPATASPNANCFAYGDTSGYVSRGLQSGTAGFFLAAGAAQVGFNLSYASQITVVGQEPEIAPLPQPAAAMEGFVPVLQGFTGKKKGKKQLTTGGQCGPYGCRDEWVSGVAKITTIIGLRAKVAANVPQKLKDVAPGLGVDAGIQTVTVYTFPFLHYPRVKPTGIPGEQ